MNSARLQASMRFTSEPDPSFCASVFCRRKGRKPTHVVIVGKYEFSVCKTCACNYEKHRGVRVYDIPAKLEDQR